MNLDEDDLTHQMRLFVDRGPECRRLFLSVVLPEEVDSTPFRGKGTVVEEQFRTPVGRIDLLVRNGADAVIVESKVRDGQKVYQIQKYHEYWSGLTGKAPSIVWLLRRRARMCGEERYLTSWKTWDDLAVGLEKGADTLAGRESKAALREFLAYLRDSGVLIADEGKRVARRKGKGYDRGLAEMVLSGIGNAFGDSDYTVQETNELPHRLDFGLKRWASEFGDGAHRRLILYYWPEDGMIRFLPQVLLYHRHLTKNLEYAAPLLRGWCEKCARAGLVVWRNAPGKWKGKYNLRVEPPYEPGPALRFVFAEQETGVSRKSLFREGDLSPEQTVSLGVSVLAPFVSLVDSLEK